MAIQRSIWVYPKVVAGAIVPTAATFVADCQADNINRAYISITTAQASDPLWLAWVQAVKNSGSIRPFAAGGEPNWAQAANHTTALNWMTAVCTPLDSAFRRLFDGVIFDIEPWTTPAIWTHQTKLDWVTLQNLAWANATDFNPAHVYNPGGSASLVMMNALPFWLYQHSVQISGVWRALDRLMRGHGQFIMAYRNVPGPVPGPNASQIELMLGSLCTAKSTYWHLDLGMECNPVPPAQFAYETYDGTNPTGFTNFRNYLIDYYTNTSYEAQVQFVGIHDYTAWKALP